MDYLVSSGGCPVGGNLNNMYIPYREEAFQPSNPFEKFVECPHPDKQRPQPTPTPPAPKPQEVNLNIQGAPLISHYEKLVDRLEKEIERLTAELEKERASHGSI